MTKSLIVDPAEARKGETLRLGAIPVNAYKKTLEDELAKNPAVTPTSCLRIYRDMVLIREFETMLDQIKKLGAYEGISYKHQGPAHLSLGQEGAAVGESFHLKVEDHIFGSHRSHGEVIAKGLRAVLELAGNSLRPIMEGYMGGTALRLVEQNEPDRTPLSIAGTGKKPAFASTDEEEQGVDYLLYGLLAEIFGREHGFNKGMGGSMHVFFCPFGIYPNNAIVGGSADIATGAALCKKVLRQPGVVVANIGDASVGCGPVWEALGFAAMGQYRSLWEKEYRGGLPIIYNFMDNFYGMGGQPIGETMGFERLARVGAAVNPENMHAETVDGNNPLSLADAYQRKINIIKKEGGPVLLDVLCYRQTGHSPSDQSAYRVREEIDLWRAVDPILEFGGKLLDAGVAGQDDLDAVKAYATRKVRKACKLATDLDLSPRLQLGLHSGLAEFMFSNAPEEELPGLKHKTDVRIPKIEDNPRVQQIARKARQGLDADGKALKGSKAVTFNDAIFEALIHHFYNDWRLVAYGEENRDWGGAFAVYQGLTESLPYHRLFNTPISEGAIVGTAVGFALEGGRAIPELMYCDFLGRAGDEVFNQLAKWQAMSGGYCHMPVVLRVSVGNKYGAQHSQDWTALTAHIPGLKVAFPATPHDAKGLMATALRGNDPVVFFESQRLYNQTEIFWPDGVPGEYYTIPMGEPAVLKEGTDLTILTFGATLYVASEAIQRIEGEFGLSVELIDGRCLVPFNHQPLVDSLKKTGKLIIASDACERGSYLHTIAGQVSQIAFDYLDAPVCVIGAHNWIVPLAEMETEYFPQPGWFLDAYHTQIAPLPGYRPGTDRAPEAMVKLSQYGVL